MLNNMVCTKTGFYCLRATFLQHVFNMHADDTQLYISVPAASCQEAIERFAGCLERVRDWMASNHLKLNEDKTQIIWLGTRHQLNKTLPQTLTLWNGTVLQFSCFCSNNYKCYNASKYTRIFWCTLASATLNTYMPRNG